MTAVEHTHTKPFMLHPTNISYSSLSITSPRYAGYWQHGNTTLAMTKKPRWLTRIMMRLVFETTWKDNTEK